MRQLIIKKQLNNFLVGGRRSLGGRVSKNRFFFEDTDARYDVCKKDVSRHVSPNKQMWLDGREAGIFTGWLINCSCFRWMRLGWPKWGYLFVYLNLYLHYYLFFYLYIYLFVFISSFISVTQKNPHLGTTRPKSQQKKSSWNLRQKPVRRGIPEGHSAIGFVCALPESPSPTQQEGENQRDDMAIFASWCSGWGRMVKDSWWQWPGKKRVRNWLVDWLVGWFSWIQVLEVSGKLSFFWDVGFIFLKKNWPFEMGLSMDFTWKKHDLYTPVEI